MYKIWQRFVYKQLASSAEVKWGQVICSVILLFAFFLIWFKFSRAYCYLFKSNLNLFISSYLSFFLLIIYLSAYRDAKFKVANQTERSLLRDVIQDLVTWYVYRDAKFKVANETERSLLPDIIRDLVTWYVYCDAKFKMAERCHIFFWLRLSTVYKSRTILHMYGT